MVRNLMLIFGLSLAVAAFGCDSESTDKTDAGTGGSGAGGSGAGGSGAGGSTPLPTDACDNTADRALLEGGTEPPADTNTACGFRAITTPATCDNNGAGWADCLQTGADGAATPTELSDGCTACYAALSCCGLNACGPAGANVCLGVPEPGDACDMCTDTNCGAAFTECSGLPYGFGRPE